MPIALRVLLWWAAWSVGLSVLAIACVRAVEWIWFRD